MVTIDEHAETAVVVETHQHLVVDTQLRSSWVLRWMPGRPGFVKGLALPGVV